MALNFSAVALILAIIAIILANIIGFHENSAFCRV